MLKNTTGQKWRVFAFNTTTNQKVTGDAANITAKLSIDYGALAAVADTNPTEAEDGYYYFDLTQAETNGNIVELFPESVTSGVQVLGVPARELPSIANEIKAKTDLIGTAAATQLVRQAASKITIYIGERHTFTINVNNDYTARTVTLCFEATDATADISVIANGSLTKTTSSVAFAIPEAVTTTDRNLRWSIRDAATKEVLEFGLAYVRPQALADS